VLTERARHSINDVSCGGSGELLRGGRVGGDTGAKLFVVVEGRERVEIAALAGVSHPTVNLWSARFEADGVAGLLDRQSGGVRGRILTLTRTVPAATGVPLPH